MTQEEQKGLLLRDLSARLQYGVKCKLIYNNKAIKDEDATLFAVDKYGHFLFAEFGEDTREFVCKPYLIPLSKMTEEQLFEVQEILGKNEIKIEDGFLSIVDSDRNTISYLEILALLEWFYKNHFDIYGLIPMGLAIDATGLNIY